MLRGRHEPLNIKRKEKFVLNTDHFYVENYPEVIDSVAKKISKFFEEVFFRK